METINRIPEKHLAKGIKTFTEAYAIAHLLDNKLFETHNRKLRQGRDNILEVLLMLSDLHRTAGKRKTFSFDRKVIVGYNEGVKKLMVNFYSRFNRVCSLEKQVKVDYFENNPTKSEMKRIEVLINKELKAKNGNLIGLNDYRTFEIAYSVIKLSPAKQNKIANRLRKEKREFQFARKLNLA